ncbi:hypothetical protein HanOQP8_Chr02g0041041 [Helianthus annuus]|nr:hypothetical protein HanOQP8_Chr02g0041041 [Helianthus annuus]
MFPGGHPPFLGSENDHHHHHPVLVQRRKTSRERREREIKRRGRENRRSETWTAGRSIYPVVGVRSPAVQDIARRNFRSSWGGKSHVRFEICGSVTVRVTTSVPKVSSDSCSGSSSEVPGSIKLQSAGQFGSTARVNNRFGSRVITS